MTTTLVQANAAGTRLELVIEIGHGPKMRLIGANEKVITYWQYEYWESGVAQADFAALVEWMLPGEGLDVEEAVSGDAASGAGGGRADGGATGRVLRPRRQRSRRKGASAGVGSASVSVGDAHGG